MSNHIKEIIFTIANITVEIEHNTAASTIVATAESDLAYKQSPMFHVSDFATLELTISAAVGYVMMSHANMSLDEVVSEM